MTLLHRVYSSFWLNLSPWRGLLLAFVVGFGVRLIPELLASPLPIGYDTVHYVAMTKQGLGWPHWTAVFSTWLLYALLNGLYQLSRVDPVLLVKLAAPVLYGLNAGGIYFFAKEALGWNVRKVLLAGGFFVIQLAAFRISWDLLRSTLGMAILLFALPFVLKLKSMKDFAIFMLLSLLVVFGHELASVVMLAVVLFGLLFKDLLIRNWAKLLKLSVAILPATAVFFASMYFRVFPVQLEVETNVVSGLQSAARPGGLFFLANYFDGSRSGSFAGYFGLASNVLSVFIVLYLLLLPLVLVGFFRAAVLDAWTAFLACAAFSCLVVPFCALDVWDRWLFLLVYPLTLYAVNGLDKVFTSASGTVRPTVAWLKWLKVSKGAAVGLTAGMLVLTGLYVGTTLQSDNYVVFSIPTISRYFSVAPAVPLCDVEATMEVMTWLDGTMNAGSCVLVHSAFLSWARLYLNDDHLIVVYETDVDGALEAATDHNLGPVYLVWWGENIGWYWFTVPPGFEEVFAHGRMAAFQYSV